MSDAAPGQTPLLPTLLTFAPMVDSELSRLILRHHRVGYHEADHDFGWVSLLTLRHGGYGRIPLLHGGGGPALTGPLNIVAHYDSIADPDRRLVPPQEPLGTRVRADTDRFNGRFALDVAAFSYHHLLPARELMQPIFAAPVSPREARALDYGYRPTRLLFRILLRLNAGHAADALRRIEVVFDRTAARVADGRPWLDGDRRTLADLALMASAAPLLQPQGYGTRMPPPAMMPPYIAGVVAALRAHPLAAFVTRAYAALDHASR